MRRTAAALAFAVALMAAGAARATTRPVVVELFTSEGCSSCPPADAFLTSLAGRGDILPLAFHVTYWNSLGWRDPYSLDLATSRQAMYAARLGGGSYTPEMVVDGLMGMVGSDRDQAAAAISNAHGAATDGATIRVTRSGRDVRVSVGAAPGRGRVMLIGFDPRHTTRVGRGENSGRTLVESNIVRSLKTIGAYDGAPIELSAALDAGERAAVVIQGYDGRILGAARL
jgi:hypothetical protein